MEEPIFNELQERYDSLVRRYNSMVESVEMLVKEKQELLNRNSFLEAQLTNSQRSADITKEIMRQNIEQNNELKERNSQEIIELRQEIKALKQELNGK